jgi:uncharacterized protein YndB with AHSA1/START domain
VSDAYVVQMQVRLEARPDVVFAFLVDPERYVRWQGVRAELDPRPGGVYRVWMDDQTVAVGEYVEVTPPTRVAFTWGWEGSAELPPGSSTVEIDLAPDGDGTTLVLRHSGLPDGASAAMHEEGWRFFTSRLSIAVVGRDPGPMPERPGSEQEPSP